MAIYENGVKVINEQRIVAEGSDPALDVVQDGAGSAIRVAGGDLDPASDNVLHLGDGEHRWKRIYIEGVYMNSGYALLAGTNLYETRKAWLVKNAAAAVAALQARAAASQTANIFEAQNSSGVALFAVDKDGFPVVAKVKMEHHTADDTLTKEESGSIHTNLGEDGAMTLTLPQDATVGCYFDFVVMVAQELRIDPGAAGAIYINGAKQTDDKYITADDEAESVRLVCDGNGDWIAFGPVGTWGVEG